MSKYLSTLTYAAYECKNKYTADIMFDFLYLTNGEDCFMKQRHGVHRLISTRTNLSRRTGITIKPKSSVII